MGVEEKGDDILYHYCSTAAFHSIISSRSIRLSALALSNDSMEGKMLIDAFTRLAKNDELEREKPDFILKILELHHQTNEGFGFCLSSERDLLSQWRGYADDGRGVAIGFSKAWLEQLTEEPKRSRRELLELKKVEYDLSEPYQEVQRLYDDYKRAMSEGVHLEVKRYSWISPRTSDQEVKRHASITAQLDLDTMMITSAFQFALKASAFHEEKEWRLLRSVDIRQDESNMGIASKVKYAPKGDRMVAYVDYQLDDMDVDLIGALNFGGSTMKLKPIIEVILGPKHRTPKHMVEQFLRSKGFNVHVAKSAASLQ